MINWILASIFSFVVIFAFYKITLYFMKKRTPTYKVKDNTYNNYFVVFETAVIPDIRQNKVIMSNIMIKYTIKNGFVVSSKISGENLKTLLMQQYQLTPKQVQVTQGNLFI